MRRHLISLGFVLLLLMPEYLYGNQKPMLTVRFSIDQTDYADYFASEKLSIENQVNKAIIDTLAGYFGFLNFTEEQSADTVIITLDDKDKTTIESQLREVVFWITMKGPQAPGDLKPIDWSFSPQGDYDLSLGEAPGFTKRVIDTFNINFLDRRDELVDMLFKDVVIASRAFPVPDRPRWILPFTKESMRTELNSKFRLDAEVKDLGLLITKPFEIRASGKATQEVIEYIPNLPTEYSQGMLVAETEKPEDASEKSICQNDLETIKIYILQYIPATVKMMRAISSDSANKTFEGGQ